MGRICTHTHACKAGSTVVQGMVQGMVKNLLAAASAAVEYRRPHIVRVRTQCERLLGLELGLGLWLGLGLGLGEKILQRKRSGDRTQIDGGVPS